MDDVPRQSGRYETLARFAPKPTRFTRAMRTFLPWQLWRFLWINLR